MDKAREIDQKYSEKLDRMHDIAKNSGYETATAICSAGTRESEHMSDVIVGSINEASSGNGCLPGTNDEVIIHTHPKHNDYEPASPPSDNDLRTLDNDGHTHCLLLPGYETKKNGEQDYWVNHVTTGDMGTLICMDAQEDLSREDIDYITSPDGRELKSEHLERMEEKGIDVTIKDRTSYGNRSLTQAQREKVKKTRN